MAKSKSVDLVPHARLLDLYFLAPVVGSSANDFRQGQIRYVACREPVIYMVEFFSWLDGTKTHEELVALTAMTGWRFFLDGETFLEAGKRISRAAQELTSDRERA